MRNIIIIVAKILGTFSLLLRIFTRGDTAYAEKKAVIRIVVIVGRSSVTKTKSIKKKSGIQPFR